MKENYGCPVQAAINLIAGKWKVMILWHLSFGRRRFAEVRDLLPGVTEKVLTDQLRQLEADGLVHRCSDGKVPARVDYSLTSAAEELIPQMEKLCSWGSKHLGITPTLVRDKAAVPPSSAH